MTTYSSYNTLTNTIEQTNIVNVGNGCGGNNECTDGYSLYFPCTKNITRGQNVCFDFYVADNANEDEMDLRDLESLTLELSGRFGCTYNTYTYPTDIISLQTESYKEILYDNFDDKYANVCVLSLKSIDENINEIKPNVTGQVGDFYYGSHIKLVADDTPTHIFIGWGKSNDIIFDSECDGFSINDLIVSTSKTYEFDIECDIELYAIYRERKEYNIIVDENNKHSFFKINTDEEKYLIKYTNGISILEGYHFLATCIPNKGIDNSFFYTFKEWEDGYDKMCREFVANDDNYFVKDNNISLIAECVKTSNYLNIINDIEKTKDDFKYNNPEVVIISEDFIVSETINNDNISSYENANIIYNNNDSYVLINDGYIKTNNINISDGVKIKLTIKIIDNCTIYFKTNDSIISYQIDASDSESEIKFESIECIFKKCNYSPLTIEVDGVVFIDDITIYEENIIDKGKAELCLSSEDTLKMYTGTLYASGAISSNGNIYGISSTLIGNINNLKKINIV